LYAQPWISAGSFRRRRAVRRLVIEGMILPPCGVEEAA
jgi:hypothetical protein